MRTKDDILIQYAEYIESLVDNNLSDADLIAWIKNDAVEYGEELTEKEIEWIIEAVRERESHNLIWYLDNKRGELTEKAQRFIEGCDQLAIKDFGFFESSKEVNEFAEEYGEN